MTEENMKYVQRHLNINLNVDTRYMFNENRELYGLAIKTLEGVMKAYPGDWIIKGVQGECYPCKPDIFEATYEPV